MYFQFNSYPCQCFIGPEFSTNSDLKNLESLNLGGLSMIVQKVENLESLRSASIGDEISVFWRCLIMKFLCISLHMESSVDEIFLDICVDKTNHFLQLIKLREQMSTDD